MTPPDSRMASGVFDNRSMSPAQSLGVSHQPFNGGIRTSTLSMATTVLAGPSLNPNPSDHELYNALRNFSSTQDLMTVTKKTAREAMAARFPALASRPQHHPDHSLSLHNLTEALIWRHKKKGTVADIREAAQLYHEPLCSEGTYLRSIAAGADDVDDVIEECNNVPTDASDEGIHLRKVVLELCSLGHRLRPGALDALALQLKHGLTSTAALMILTRAYDLIVKPYPLFPEGLADRDGY
ncbi:hypothetical protein CY34DRAFT_19597 [Suillus luteus UH-Slu-Lm8-n1]|uniref:DEK-C domain-containing protein n=1 Tax=Suillus luteus UH-Slu-Lm8-n1 TaxID=930992 RepID=A0A0C9ZR04_9AGAM|nr:hypothetical protein CY34DRAFT_19597 [Suillus luteus UH-Slu-Lm8-n1]